MRRKPGFVLSDLPLRDRDVVGVTHWFLAVISVPRRFGIYYRRMNADIDGRKWH